MLGYFGRPTSSLVNLCSVRNAISARARYQYTRVHLKKSLSTPTRTVPFTHAARALAKELMRLGFADSQLPAWMKKPDSDEVVEAVVAEAVKLAEAVDSVESIPVETLIPLPTLGSLPEPRGLPIVVTEDIEAPPANESNEALNRSNELTDVTIPTDESKLTESPLPSS